MGPFLGSLRAPVAIFSTILANAFVLLMLPAPPARAHDIADRSPVVTVENAGRGVVGLGEPSGLQVPELPVPEIPELPQVPEIPEQPQVPEAPDLPGAPDLPEVPDIPGLPEGSAGSETPDGPTSTEGAETPEAPPISEVPGGAGPGVPEGPGSPSSRTGPSFPLSGGPAGGSTLGERGDSERQGPTPALNLRGLATPRAPAGSASAPLNEEPGVGWERALLDTSKQYAFPFLLLIAVGLFLFVQNRFDGKDPKLVKALTHGREELLSFE